MGIFLLFWLAATGPLKVADITEMGCKGTACVTLEELSHMPPERIPDGCILQVQQLEGRVNVQLPVLVCGENLQRDAAKVQTVEPVADSKPKTAPKKPKR